MTEMLRCSSRGADPRRLMPMWTARFCGTSHIAILDELVG